MQYIIFQLCFNLKKKSTEKVHGRAAVFRQSVPSVYLHFGFGFPITSTTNLFQKMTKVHIYFSKMFYHSLILGEYVPENKYLVSLSYCLQFCFAGFSQPVCMLKIKSYALSND